jgi:hypothetical protein
MLGYHTSIDLTCWIFQSFPSNEVMAARLKRGAQQYFSKGRHDSEREVCSANFHMSRSEESFLSSLEVRTVVRDLYEMDD